MTIRKPPGKRLTSLLLSLALLLTLVPAMGTTASAANAAPHSVAVTINGTSINLTDGDYVETNTSSGKKTYAATEPGSYVAWYYGGVLTLNGYDGGRINTSNSSMADTTIMLKGSNKVTVDEKACNTEVSSRGIYHNGGGDLTITGASGSTLEVDVASGGRAYAIVTNDSQVGDFDGTLTIGGSAKVSIRAETTASAGTTAYGIYVPGGVTIGDAASLDVTCETNRSSAIAQDASKMGAGILTRADGTKSLTIDTSGAVRLDFSKADNAYSTCVLDARRVVLTRGRLEMFWKLTTSTDEFGYSDAIEQGTEKGKYAERQRKDVDGKKGAAVFVAGTPRTLKLVNALDADWSVNNDNEVQYVAGEEVTLKPLSIAGVSSTGWKSEDVEISGSTFTMPDADVTVEGLYNVFAQQPSFERNADNKSGTISFKLNGSPTNTRPALVRENSNKVVYLTDTSVTDDGRKYNIYNNDGEYGVPPGQYRVRVEYGNYTFCSDVFTVKYAAPAASVADVTVSGKAGEAVNGTVTVTLENDTFVSPLSGNWITNLPDGLSQSVTRTDERTATITITGTPQVGSNAEMEITIPAGALVDESSTSVTVSTGGKAKFNITSNAPTAENIQIGDGSNNKFSTDKLYYKNGENGAKGTFSNDSSNWNAYYNPATGTLTLNSYNGPYIKIIGSSEQMVTIELEGSNNKVGSEWDHAIWLVGGVNLRITADSDAILTLTGGTNYCGIGSASASDVGFVTISGSANVTINASTDNSLSPAYGIRSGKDVAVLGGASLKITCSSDGGTIKGYGIYTPSGKVTVNTTGTVDINASRCANSDTYCIYANSIAFKNAEKIMLTYASVCSPTYPGASLTDRFDASGMKSPKTTADSATGVTTVTYAKLGAKPAKPRIKLPSNNQDDITGQNFLITLEHDDSSVKIYYTTDGTSPTTDGKTPTKDSIQYEAPFNVGKSCTVKAVAYSEGDEQCSDVVEQVLKWHRYKINKTTAGVTVCDEHGNPFPDGIEPWTKVYIKAPPTRTSTSGEEQIFVGWNEISNATINDPSANETYFIMPYQDISITARYDKAPDGVTVSGQVTSYGNAAEAVTVTLTKSGESTPAQTVTISAPGSGSAPFVQDYSFSAVPDGEYTLKVEKKGHAPRTEEITVENTAITKDVTVYLIGDVNGDGRVNGTDKAILTRYLANWPGYKAYVVSMAAADINQDGTVNGTDKAILIRYLAGYSSYNSFFE